MRGAALECWVAGDSAGRVVVLGGSSVEEGGEVEVWSEAREMLEEAEEEEDEEVEVAEVTTTRGEALFVDVRFERKVPSRSAMRGDGGGNASVEQEAMGSSCCGFVVVVVAIDQETGKIVSGPEILSRGFVYMDHSEELMQEAGDYVREVIEKLPEGESQDWAAVQGDVRQALKRFLEKRTTDACAAA